MSQSLREGATTYALNRVENAVPIIRHYDHNAELSEIQDALTQIRDRDVSIKGKTVKGLETRDYEHNDSRFIETLFSDGGEGYEIADLLDNIVDTRDHSPRASWKIVNSRRFPNGDRPRYDFMVSLDLEEGAPVKINGIHNEYHIPQKPFQLKLAGDRIAGEEIERSLGNRPQYTEVYEVSLTPEEAVEFFETDSEGAYNANIRGRRLGNRSGSETAVAVSPMQRSKGEPEWEGEFRIDEKENAEISGLRAEFIVPENYQGEREDDPVDLYIDASGARSNGFTVPVQTKVNGKTEISAQEAKEILDGERLL